jgi:hypothetical protein
MMIQNLAEVDHIMHKYDADGAPTYWLIVTNKNGDSYDQFIKDFHVYGEGEMKVTHTLNQLLEEIEKENEGD